VTAGARAHGATTGSGTDKAARVLTGLTLAGLAGVAGAISFSHMTELAAEHGQTGWRALAFPVSVDGLEIVASLFLVAQRRAGRRVGRAAVGGAERRHGGQPRRERRGRRGTT
jgi:Protein of unknown function (DUF2637)